MRDVVQALQRLEEQTRRALPLAASRWIIGLMALLIPVHATWFISHLDELSRDLGDTKVRIRIIEEQRFTAADAERMRASILEGVAERFPPPWMSEQLRRIEAVTQRTDERLQALEQRLTALEVKVERER